MQLSDFLAQIRNHYTDAFAGAIADKRNAPSQWLIEHTFGIQADQEESEGLNLPMRHDLIPMKDGEIDAVMVIQAETTPSFEPIGAELDEAKLVIAPFTWDQCQIAVEGLSDDSDWRRLIDWFMRWFDPGNEGEPDRHGLRNVIHAFFEPQADEEGRFVVLDLDLGTSPVDSLLDLLETLQAMGATALHVAGDLLERPDEAAGGE